MNYILKILLSAVAVIILAKLIPGVTVDTYTTAIWVAFLIGIFDSFLKPILVVLTIPVTILTLGLFLFAINAGLILLADNWIDGFSVSGFWVALLFSILLSFLESILYKVLEK
ncbi:MAG: phage holin family protein [Flavobacteriaceae bacterium]|nr:phage holin family protein [Flavobacteriaceae bacterium]